MHEHAAHDCQTINHWLTGNGRYMPRWCCVDGDPLGWLLILADVGVSLLYLALVWRWLRAWLAVPADKRPIAKLVMAAIFGFCGLSGYGTDAVMYWLPVYPVQAVFKVYLLVSAGAYYWFYADDVGQDMQSRQLRDERDEALRKAAESAAATRAALDAVLHAFAASAGAAVAICAAEPGLHYQAVNARWLRDFGLPGKPAVYVGRSHLATFPDLYETHPHWQLDHQRAISGHASAGEELFRGRTLRWLLIPTAGLVVMVCSWRDDPRSDRLTATGETLRKRLAQVNDKLHDVSAWQALTDSNDPGKDT